jgi:polygalacturonase
MRLLVLATVCIGLPALAQDTRKVVEPTIPPACTVLKAKLGRAGTSIVPEDEAKLDTARIQAALDACPAGRAVVLQPAAYRTDAFLSGPLDLRKGVTLVVDRGAYLFGSRNPRDYDAKPGVCGTIVQEGGRGCRGLINGDGVADAGIMGDGVIDGRGGETILGQSITWWNLADKARAGGSQQNPRLIVLNQCDNFTLYRITLMNSPNFHVGYSGGNGFTAWGVRILTPPRARNTDGIDPGNCQNVTITRCYISTGDDHVAIKAGGHVSHVTVSHNHFYAGHGMSIGSETYGGADTIRVSDLSIEGADNGIHLKSNITRGGLVHDAVFDDICIRDTQNPILVETAYTAHASPTENRPPDFRDILFRNIAVFGSGKVTLEGLDANHKLKLQFNNVSFDKLTNITVRAVHAEIDGFPGRIEGDDVTLSGKVGNGTANACTDKFVPFPLR